MTVIPGTGRSPVWVADGTNRTWFYGFRALTPAHVRLLVTDPSGNVSVITSGLEVSGLGNPNGGSVQYPLAPAAPFSAGTKVQVVRRVPRSQPNRIGNQGAFHASTHEDTFDLLAMQIQEIYEEGTARGLTAPFEDGTPDMSLPPLAERAGKILEFDDVGRPVVVTDAESFRSFTEALPGTIEEINVAKNAAIAAAGAAVGIIDSSPVGGPFAVPNIIPRSIKENFDDFISLPRFRRVGDSDWGVTLQRAVNSHPAIWIPAGEYTSAAPIAMGYAGTTVKGAGRKATYFRSSAPGIDLFRMTDGTNSIHIEGMTLGSSVTPTGGAAIASRGIADQIYIRDILIEGAYNGLFLGGTGVSYVDNVVIQRCHHDAVVIQNTPASGGGGGGCQWNIKGLLAQLNDGNGFTVRSVPGSSQITLGDWINVMTYSNSGNGAVFAGRSDVPIYGIRIRSGFFGEDRNSELLLDTYGDQHNIEMFQIELPGRTNTGRSWSTPPSLQGHGIEITANNRSVGLRNGYIKAASWDGIRTAASELTEIVGVRIEDCGVSSTAGQRNGIAHTGAGDLVCTGVVARNTGAGTSQQYGINANDGTKVSITGGSLKGNSVGPAVFASNEQYAHQVGVLGGRVVANKGTSTASTDANGRVVVNHGMAVTPGFVFSQIVGSVPYKIDLESKSATTMTFRVLNTTTGAAIASTAVTFYWQAAL